MHICISPQSYLYYVQGTKIDQLQIYGLVQDCSNSSVLAMELLQSCTKP